MRRTLVVNLVGLTPALLQHAPTLKKFAEQGALRPLKTITPAVTCSVQSTMLTGSLPSQHGIVGNGWYFHELSQIWFWRQSNHLVAGEKVWETAKQRDPSFTCAQLFWWYNMYSSADMSATPRPMYTADGRKLPDVYTEPPALRDVLSQRFGTFPLFDFWGPRAGITSSQWIVDATIFVLREHQPTLTFAYLPHLDYDLQRYGPNHPKAQAAVAELDSVVSELLEFAEREGLRVILVSEYGITDVGGAVFINRALREAGLLRVRPELGREQLDAGASDAFAVADHQIAHVYVKDPTRLGEVKTLLESVDGIEAVWGAEQQATAGIAHARSGDLVAISRADRWFAYYHWLDDERAPDYARTVDIHAKPGYDPVELFVDPSIVVPAFTVGRKLMARKLGFRTLLDVIPLDPSLVKGSHGRPTDDDQHGPLFISNAPDLVEPGPVAAAGVRDSILQHLFE